METKQDKDVKMEESKTEATPNTESVVTDDTLETKIKEILPTLDLEKTSGKAVRGLLEKEFGISLKDRRKFIDQIILKVIDDQNKKKDAESDQSEKKNSEPKNSEKKKTEIKKKPSKKKGSKKASIETDQALAEELAAEEGRPRRAAAAKSYARAERNRKAAEKPRKKSTKSKRPPVKMHLAPQLAEFLGEDRMTRGDVSKKLWAYIKEHNLQDPSNRQKIKCDEKLSALFKRSTLTMFNINKFLAKMYFRPSEVDSTPASDHSEEE